jgi:uncharacterized membrane protein
MADRSFRGRARQDASGIAATVVTGSWLALLMLDAPSGIWLAVMLFGYIAVVPVVSMLFDEEEEATEQTTESGSDTTTASDEADEEAALQRLRRRYAEGELTDEQFERKLERLLETETLEDVEDARRGTDPAETPREQRERDLE